MSSQHAKLATDDGRAAEVVAVPVTEFREAREASQEHAQEEEHIKVAVATEEVAKELPQQQQQHAAPTVPVNDSVAQQHKQPGAAQAASPEMPQHQADQLARESSRSLLPAWCAKIGVDGDCRSVEAVKRVVNFSIYARITLALLLLVSWACAASATSTINEALAAAQKAAAQNSLNINISANISPLSWGLAVGLLGFMFVIAQGVLAFLSLSPNTSLRVTQITVKSGVIGDFVLLFMAMSAFTALAVTSVQGAATMSLTGFSDGGVSSTIAAAAAFMFFAWVALLYSFALSLVIFKDRGMLYAEHSPLHQGGNNHPEQINMQQHIAEV